MYVQCTSFRSHSGKYLADDFLLGIQFARNRPKQMKKFCVTTQNIAKFGRQAVRQVRTNTDSLSI